MLLNLVGQPRDTPIKGYRKAAGKCSNTCRQPIGEEAELPSGYQQKCGNLLPFSLKCHVSVTFITYKSKELWRILKHTPPYFALSNHSNFCLAQTGATVPLKSPLHWPLHVGPPKIVRRTRMLSSLKVANGAVKILQWAAEVDSLSMVISKNFPRTGFWVSFYIVSAERAAEKRRTVRLHLGPIEACISRMYRI